MNKLRVAFVDFWPEFKEENIFLPILQKYFNVEITTFNPDVVIHSIFGGMKESPNYKCKKILFLGENYRYHQFNSNYAISFDPKTENNYRLPLWQYYLLLNPTLKQKLLFEPRINHEKFDRGCSFVVSNPNNFLRNAFYDALKFQSWMQVFSYGRFKTNNFELQKESQGKYWRDAKYSFFNRVKHQFNICFEHSSFPYYCTEKIMDSFLGGSIPIYWGDPKIKEDWNEEAFINVGRLGQDKSIELIQKLNSDKNTFNEMYRKPIFTDIQREKHIKNIDNFEPWLIEKIK